MFNFLKTETLKTIKAELEDLLLPRRYAYEAATYHKHTANTLMDNTALEFYEVYSLCEKVKVELGARRQLELKNGI